MSTLLIDELYNGVTFPQDFTIDRPINVAHIRVWIYKQGELADGEMVCEVWQSTTKLSEARNDYIDLNSEIGTDYAHGMVRFDFDNLSLGVNEGNLSEQYELRFYMDNHTTDPNAFIAIVRDYENPRYVRFGDLDGFGDALNDSIESAGIEIFTYEVR